MTAAKIAAGFLAALFFVCLLWAPSGMLATLPTHVPLLAPSFLHPLGTDDLGRDMLAALLQGGRTSLSVAAAATALALGLGLGVGLVAALGSRLVDEATMRVAEIVASLPTLLLAVLVGALFGGSLANLALLLGLTRWPLVARIVRGETQALLAAEHVRAARALGATPFYIARRHLVGHLLPSLTATLGIVFGGAILAEAALAFVGLGDPQATSWGQMAASGFALIGLAWWLWLWPAIALVGASALAGLAATSGGKMDPRR